MKGLSAGVAGRSASAATSGTTREVSAPAAGAAGGAADEAAGGAAGGAADEAAGAAVGGAAGEAAGRASDPAAAACIGVAEASTPVADGALLAGAAGSSCPSEVGLETEGSLSSSGGAGAAAGSGAGAASRAAEDAGGISSSGGEGKRDRSEARAGLAVGSVAVAVVEGGAMELVERTGGGNAGDGRGRVLVVGLGAEVEERTVVMMAGPVRGREGTGAGRGAAAAGWRGGIASRVGSWGAVGPLAGRSAAVSGCGGWGAAGCWGAAGPEYHTLRVGSRTKVPGGVRASAGRWMRSNRTGKVPSPGAGSARPAVMAIEHLMPRSGIDHLGGPRSTACTTHACSWNGALLLLSDRLEAVRTVV